MSRLIINGLQFELSPSKPIARTLQVNDIATLNNRQANFTPTISVPRTANNVKNFAMLGIIGTNSNIPYQKNECYYYAESGECLIYKGWAVITATAKDFKTNLYDGNIDLYKAIENETLNALPLDEINHIKTLENVVDSINGLTEYKYILADYNGKSTYDTNKINIDYLVPSVPVSYLWNKIFEYYGFTYSGGVFDTFAFQNLYITFPKGVGSTLDDVLVYESDNLRFENNESQSIAFNPTLKPKRSAYLYQITNTTNDLQQITVNRHFEPVADGLYRLELDFLAYCREFYKGSVALGLYFSRVVFYDVWLAKNSEGIINSDNVVLIQKLASDVRTDAVSINTLISLNPNDSLCIVLRTKFDGDSCHSVIYPSSQFPVFKLSKVESQTIDFSGAFIDFKTKDFLNEVLTRFSLTPYKDKYTNNYKFLTLNELLQTTDVIDWSDKFNEQTNETYTYGSYAQKNDLTYKYNDAESDYYNGSILIDNVNLPDSKSVINSRIYAPEKVKTNVLPKETNVYKLWNKEVKDNGSVTYKSLDKRFYFLRADDYIFDTPAIIGSETLGFETTIGQAPFESYYKLPFNDIVQDFYLPIYQILNRARLLDLSIFLNDTDVVNIDFSKLYWIRQLNSYFILNKISNYTNKGITKCEMIKVDYAPQEIDLPPQLLAVADTFDVNNFDEVSLDVLNNDLLGTEPTVILSVDDSSLTCGTVTNETTSLIFTPNGVFDVAETFTYTIQDSLLNQSSVVVTLNVSEAIIEDGFRTIGSPVNSGICDIEDFISCKFKLNISGLIQNGDLCLNNDLTIFNGSNNYYKVYLNGLTDFYNVRINSSGVITVNNLC